MKKFAKKAETQKNNMFSIWIVLWRNSGMQGGKKRRGVKKQAAKIPRSTVLSMYDSLSTNYLEYAILLYNHVICLTNTCIDL